MSRDWDRHYSDGGGRNEPPDGLLVEVAERIAAGTALDLACGAGRHALHLAALGWHVTAVDRSEAAIRVLRERAQGLPVTAECADLENGGYPIEPETYDLICDFQYLHRPLFPRIREGVRPGGLFVASIALVDSDASEGPHNPDFLLEPGELRREFANWKISYYSEAARSGKPGSRRAARIVARRA